MTKTTNNKKCAFGTCAYEKEHPLDKTTITDKTKCFEYTLMLEEAFKLRESLDACIRHIFAYKQSTTVAKKARVHIVIRRDVPRICITEYPLKNRD